VGILLEIRGGAFAGRRVPVRTGETVLIGRAPDRAQFAIPHDNHMSSVHFAVECGADGGRVVDQKSTNGTLLNGGKIQEAMLATGDEIKSGQTVFVVRIVPDDKLPALQPAAAGPPPAARSHHESQQPLAHESPVSRPEAGPPAAPRPAPPAASLGTPAASPSSSPAAASAPAAGPSPSQQPASALPPSKPAPPSRPSPASVAPGKPALAIGGWSFAKIPTGWQIQEGLGIQQDAKDKFPSNLGAMEESLGPNITLQQYVEAQIKMFREYLREPRIDAAVPPKIQGAGETMALEVRYQTKEGQSIYYQRVYARRGSTVGVLTLTALEQDLASVRADYDTTLAAVSLGEDHPR